MANLLPIQRTKYTSNEKIQKKCLLVDASGKNLGRLASHLAFRLQGKYRVDYAPHQEIGDFVIVTNAAKISVTGKKMEQKLYRFHSGYPGGLKTLTLAALMEKKPALAVELAVKRMLPKGALGRKRLKNLRVYADENHEHHSQKPEVWELPTRSTAKGSTKSKNDEKD